MARRRGWAGDPPADDAEARTRIIATAARLMEQTGSQISLAEVAEALGVIRQTIYRYFDSADDLMTAAAVAAADGVIDQLARTVAGITDPAHALVEITVAALTMLPDNPQIGLLLSAPMAHEYSASVLSEASIRLGRSMIEHTDVNWRARGYDDAMLDELVEYVLRIMQSFFLTPDVPRRTESELREFLGRWIGAAVVANDLVARSRVAAS